MNLEGDVVVVTGGSSGIGRAICRVFADKGARIAVLDVREEPREGGKPTAEVLEEDGCEAIFVEADVSELEEVEDAVDRVVEAFGGIDVWVNNAGVLERGPVDEVSEEEWRRIMSVNLDGVFHGMKAALPHLKASGGQVINISSGLGKSGMATYAAYCASKFGVIGLTEASAADLESGGVRVNAVCPGLTATQMGDFSGDPPEKVAGTVLEVASASYTGRAVDVR